MIGLIASILLQLANVTPSASITIDADKLPERFFSAPHYGRLVAASAGAVCSGFSTAVVTAVLPGNKVQLTFPSSLPNPTQNCSTEITMTFEPGGQP